MNKKDLPILLLLFGLLMVWPIIDKKLNEKFFDGGQTQPVPEQASEPGQQKASVPVEPTLARPDSAQTEQAVPDAHVAVEPAESLEPEVTRVLENDHVAVTFSSHGAAARHAVIKKYRKHLEEDSEPVELDFSRAPALAYYGIPGLGTDGQFDIREIQDGLEFQRTSPSGLRLKRTVQFENGYRLKIRDEIANRGQADITLTNRMIQVGGMHKVSSAKEPHGINYLGSDALLQGGGDVKHWARKIPGWYKDAVKKGELEPDGSLLRDQNASVFWLGTKNRFFLQVLMREQGFEGAAVRSYGDPKKAQVDLVFAQAELGSLALGPGESTVAEYSYYVGPKRLAELKKIGSHLDKVLELGWFGFFGRFLLFMLNLIHDNLWPYNYGLAIMLLTVIIRVLFWPLTHKGTENMKKMQKLQPLMKEVQAKYKAKEGDSDKQKKEKMAKQQQAMMALYREHKVNPMMGCLPMLVQIPVFISLFYVLRSAIELRFAKFLWIGDLSNAERIFNFGFTIPLVGWDALNLLPLLMAATTLLQMKTAPQTGDPAQRKIFMFMPFMMLLFLYDFPAGLMLYWTTNNVFMIIQQWWQRRGQDDEKSE